MSNLEYYRREKESRWVVVTIIGLVIIAGFLFYKGFSAPKVVSRCEITQTDTTISFQTAPGAVTFARFDSFDKPCSFNALRERWEPIVYMAPPTQ